MRVMMTERAALMCELKLALGKLFSVLVKTPDSPLSTPEFKQALVDDEAEVKAARRENFLFIRREVISVPAKTPQADLA